ncbi:MAG: succinate dehydrogenase iron-sulfur subunit [Dehalococcoidia bacterium]|nr:succinate dehydrogenase iron-sulfur subunit [Dehalococcoidia bacterium]
MGAHGEEVLVEVRLKVRRYDPESGKGDYWDQYEVDVPEYATVLDSLIEVREYHDGSLGLRCSCRSAICGSCAMTVNGRARLACNTKAKDMMLMGDTIVVEPGGNLPVIKDLVVDMQPHWQKFRQVEPYLQPSGPAPEREYLVNPAAMIDLNQVMGCIQCGACVMACTSLEVDPNFIGPAALAKAYRFTGDPRDTADKHRFELYNQKGGVWDCTHCFYCVEVCPKGVAPMDQIMRIRAQMVEGGVKNSAGHRHEDTFTHSVKTSGRLNEATMVPKSLGLMNPANMAEIPGALRLAKTGKLMSAFKEGFFHRIPSAKSMRSIVNRVINGPKVVATTFPRKGERKEE